MSTVSQSVAAAALATLLDPKITSQINRSCPLAQILDVGSGNGKNIAWDVKVGTAVPTGAVITDVATVSTFNNDTKVPASLDFGTYHDGFQLSNKARRMAANAANPQQLADLFGDEMADSMERLAVAVADGIYNGDGSANTIHGLHDASIPAIGDVGIYAAVNRATYAQWQGTVIDAASADISFSLVRQLGRDIFTACGYRPDLYLCDPVQHEKFAALFEQDRRYVTEIKLPGGVIQLDGGYNVIYHDGKPIIEDQLHPAGKFSALNTQWVKLHQLPDSADAINGAVGMVTLAGSQAQNTNSRTKLVARLQPLAKVGDALPFALFCYPQLQVKKPQACGYIENLGT